MAHSGRRLLGLVLLGLLAVGEPSHARAEDRIGELTATLASSHSERERIAAVTSLARIEDKAALRPLVVALQDPSPIVRGIAAVGLGKLKHKAACPALRNAATVDADATVRERAAAALAQIDQANGLPAEHLQTAATPATATHAATVRPKIHVVIRSTTDESVDKSDPRARKDNADALRDALAQEVAASPILTTNADDVKKYGLESCQIDISITRLETRPHGGVIEVEAQLRLTISDPHGKMLSFLSGGATMQVKRHGYNLAYLPQLRKETVANAVRGLSAQLIEHLRRTLTT